MNKITLFFLFLSTTLFSQNPQQVSFPTVNGRTVYGSAPWTPAPPADAHDLNPPEYDLPTCSWASKSKGIYICRYCHIYENKYLRIEQLTNDLPADWEQLEQHSFSVGHSDIRIFFRNKTTNKLVVRIWVWDYVGKEFKLQLF